MLGNLFDKHPIIFFIGVCFVLFVFIIGIIWCCYNATSGIYEYTDLDNNVGYAENCMTDKGQLICYLKDGGVVSVKQNKKID